MAESPSASEGQMIPKAEFIGDVAKYMEGKDADKVLAELQSTLRSYRMLSDELQQKRIRTMSKLPELKRALDIVERLIEKQASGEDTTTDFMLAEGVYAKAKIRDPKTVNLWLGASVMLEYPLEEAQQLLTENHANCRANLKTSEDDLAYVKDSITTLEVSVARVYNYDMERRRQNKESGAAA